MMDLSPSLCSDFSDFDDARLSCENLCWHTKAAGNLPSSTVQAAAIFRICGGREDDLPQTYSLLQLPPRVPSNSPLYLRMPKEPLKSLKPTVGQFWLEFGKNGGTTISELDSMICNHFRQIPYHHWMRAVLGHREESVNDLLISVSMIQHKFKIQSLEGRSDINSAPHLLKPESLHPLTRGIMHHDVDLDLPMDALGNILQPIREVLQTEQLSRSYHRMMILGVRFEVAYIRPEKVDWSVRLSTYFDLYERLVSHTPEELARTMTLSDISMFDKVDVADLRKVSAPLLDERWKSLCRETAECSVACPCLEPNVSELVVKLYEIRNYYSMTAVLAGLKLAKARCLRQSLSKQFRFLKMDNNYEYCRHRTVQHVALPWHLPFKKQYRTAKNAKSWPDMLSATVNILLQIQLYSHQFHVGD